MLTVWLVDRAGSSPPFQLRAYHILAGVLLTVTLALPLTAAVREIPRWYQPSGHPGRYATYVQRVARAVAPAGSDQTGGAILANLNTGFAFSSDRLRVYRDFGAIERGDADAVAQFLRDESVAYVVLPRDELDLIYRMRPVWNAVYGNPTRFYPQLLEVVAERGTLVDRFAAPVYGMRLVRYLDVDDGAAQTTPPAPHARRHRVRRCY